MFKNLMLVDIYKNTQPVMHFRWALSTEYIHIHSAVWRVNWMQLEAIRSTLIQWLPSKPTFSLMTFTWLLLVWRLMVNQIAQEGVAVNARQTTVTLLFSPVTHGIYMWSSVLASVSGHFFRLLGELNVSFRIS